MKSGNPLLKYMMKNGSKSEIFHSSGYARTQSGGNMGVGTAESFTQRQSIEERRKFVQGFRNARIAQSRNLSLRAKTFEAGRGAMERNGANGSGVGAGSSGRIDSGRVGGSRISGGGS